MDTGFLEIDFKNTRGSSHLARTRKECGKLSMQTGIVNAVYPLTDQSIE
jgi:hypothetical protein